jgi:hypothetical protein
MLEKLIAIAESQVGVREIGGNNRGDKIREYQTATDLAPGAWPWCAAFTDWCIKEWLEDSQVAKWLNLKNRTPEEWRPKTALAYGLTAWAKKRPNTTRVFSEKDRAKLGDIVTFDFSHVGFVVSDNGIWIETLEGNTNGKGERDSESGDGVWRKVRKKTLVKDLIRINPSGSINK